MEKDLNTTDFKKKEKELLKTLEEISRKLIKRDDYSIEALYRLKELLDKTEIFELSGVLAKKTNWRLLSVIWFLRQITHDLWANMGDDSKGFPKNGGTELLQDNARYLGIFIQTSLFRNRPKDSIGTQADIIASYYNLLHLADEANKKGLTQEEYVAL